jgi:hypothetical protein
VNQLRKPLDSSDRRAKSQANKKRWWALATESRCRSWTACSVVAIADGGYPEVFNNATVDSSFGIISPIFLLELTESGEALGRLPVNQPNDNKFQFQI